MILVSDGGGSFQYGADHGLRWRLNRYLAIVDNQARALRKRWLMAGYHRQEYGGAYWGIATDVSRYASDAKGYPDDFAAAMIATIRTDLDAFTPGEIAVLENHGYALADAALRRYAPSLVRRAAPLVPPFPAFDWDHMPAARQALASSARRSWIGRF